MASQRKSRIIKLGLIIGLLMKKRAFYPVGIFVFCLFIVYQLQRYAVTHSAWMLLLSAFDALIVWLTWHEYRLLDKTQKNTRPGKAS